MDKPDFYECAMRWSWGSSEQNQARFQEIHRFIVADIGELDEQIERSMRGLVNSHAFEGGETSRPRNPRFHFVRVVPVFDVQRIDLKGKWEDLRDELVEVRRQGILTEEERLDRSGVAK